MAGFHLPHAQLKRPPFPMSSMAHSSHARTHARTHAHTQTHTLEPGTIAGKPGYFCPERIIRTSAPTGSGGCVTGMD